MLPVSHINMPHSTAFLSRSSRLPALGEVERKRRILEYVINTRQQFIKLLVLVKFAVNARNVQKCQELVPPPRMTDEEVLETFARLDDVIRMRMLISEVVPPPMRNYRIEDGRIYFHVENEFEVALTLVGPSNELRWQIVSLEILVKSSGDGGFDIDTTLSDQQINNLIKMAMQQMTPPLPSAQHLQSASASATASAANTPSATGFPPERTSTPLPILPANVDLTSMPARLPLVKLYDYLHMFCLNMQLEVLYLQAAMLVRTRWADQLRVEMTQQRTTLWLAYWLKGDAAATWSSLSSTAGALSAQLSVLPAQGNSLRRTNVTTPITQPAAGVSPASNIGGQRVAAEGTNLIEIAIVEDEERVSQIVTTEDVRGGGSMMDGRILGYPKSWVAVRWAGGKGEKDKIQLKINPANLNVERLLMQVVRANAKAMIHKFRDTLYETVTDCKAVFRVLEDDVIIVGNVTNDDNGETSSRPESSLATESNRSNSSSGTTMLVRYRENRFVSISVDVRTGRVVVSEVGTRAEDGDAKLKYVETQLNKEPARIADHLLHLRGETIIDEINSMAKQLGLEVYDKIPMRLEDMNNIFGSEFKAPPLNSHGLTPGPTIGASTQLADIGPKHKTFLQFSQYQDFYLVIAVVENRFRFWLAGANRPEQSSTMYTLTSVTPMNFDALWRDHFKIAPRVRRAVANNAVATGTSLGNVTRKRKIGDTELSENTNDTFNEPLEGDRVQVDELRMDLRFLAKLDSFCRAHITYTKLEQQLALLRTSDKKITYRKRRVPNTLAAGRGQGGVDEQNNASIESVPVIWIKQEDLPLPDPNVMASVEGYIVLRVDGWWACGRSECYVVADQKMEADKVPPINPSSDFNHIRYDKATGLLSFTYTNINSCVQQFVEDRERVVMMIELARQLSSQEWLAENDFVIDSFDWQTLQFVYAKRFSLSIRWRAEPGDNQKRVGRYVLDFSEVEVPLSLTDSSLNAQPKVRNPHWRVATFLEETLNRNRSLTDMIEMMNKTLPLMLLLDELESAYKRAGAFDRITIIPRSAEYGLDVKYTKGGRMQITDASKAAITSLYIRNSEIPKFDLPNPYVVQPNIVQFAKRQAGTAESTDFVPIQIAKKLELKDFTIFQELVKKKDEWILANDVEGADDELQMVVDGTKNEDRMQESAASAFDTVFSFEYGLVFSPSLCGTVLRKVDDEFKKMA
ncbi:hypothetical protein BC937DRAFT_94940 [Endogone sp. FLAS-F59071]|nr:hypothetical protein BC937DRAFT_94940 [Endogone sp. FLAS-F59071]|eukprot:RUS20565.1 hypothetical protein BC937DRAFT_94940 [Endogone sp. FLAS-F59071]